MIQLNVALTEADAAGLQRIMDRRGLTRPKAVLAVLREAVAAQDEGRLAFAATDAPKLDLSVRELCTEVRTLQNELDRTLRSVTDHERKLAKAMETNEGSIAAAEQRLRDALTERNKATFQPFVEKVRQIHQALQDAVGQLEASAAAARGATDARLDRIEALAREPRVQRNLVFKDSSWTLGSLGLTVGVIAFLAILLFLLTAGQFGFGVATASRMLGNPPRVCAMIERKYGAKDCRVPEPYRSLGLLANGRKP